MPFISWWVHYLSLCQRNSSTPNRSEAPRRHELHFNCLVPKIGKYNLAQNVRMAVSISPHLLFLLSESTRKRELPREDEIRNRPTRANLETLLTNIVCQFGSVHLCSSLTCLWAGRLWGQGWSSALHLFLDGSKPKPSQWWAATLIPLKASFVCRLDLVFMHLSQSYPLNAWNPVQGLSSHLPTSFQGLFDNSGAAKSQHWGKKQPRNQAWLHEQTVELLVFILWGFFTELTLTLCLSFSICRKASFCKAL